MSTTPARTVSFLDLHRERAQDFRRRAHVLVAGDDGRLAVERSCRESGIPASRAARVRNVFLTTVYFAPTPGQAGPQVAELVHLQAMVVGDDQKGRLLAGGLSSSSTM